MVAVIPLQLLQSSIAMVSKYQNAQKLKRRRRHRNLMKRLCLR